VTRSEQGNKGTREQERASANADHPPGWDQLSSRKRRLLSPRLPLVTALWERQENLRRPLGGRTRSATCERLLPIAERLAAGATPEECERVLQHCAREAEKREEEKLKWFNGETNWRKDNFARALGMADSANGVRRKPDPWGRT
jgi:hypothetical protein